MAQLAPAFAADSFISANLRSPFRLEDSMTDLQITYRDPSHLKRSSGNARTHSPKQILQIARSISLFGFNNPILVDGEGMIVAGHGRVAAALELGVASVPTVLLDHLSPAQKRAYIIADNKLAEQAGWDKGILQIELQGLTAAGLDFDLTDLGFETGEIDLLLTDDPNDLNAEEAEEGREVWNDLPEVARPGDLWLLDEHRLFCGDALDRESFKALLGKERAQMIFADPPFNVKINGHVSGKGSTKHPEFMMASGEMSSQEFTCFLRTSFERMAAVSADGAVHFIYIDWRHLGELLSAGAGAYSEILNLCVWVKTNAGMGSLYRSQHELVAVFRSGTGKHVNNVELGRHGRNRTNVWTYAGMNSFQSGRDDTIRLHPTVKPTALVADAIMDCSKRGDIILDPFAGSGTTILAAQRTGRQARCIELDPRYVDVALHRFRTQTRIDPVHAFTGAVFGDETFSRGRPPRVTSIQRKVKS
jgi:DNA modification methylase